jgi:hypothetical protein
MLLSVALFQGFLGLLTSFWPLFLIGVWPAFEFYGKSLIAPQVTLGAVFERKGTVLA